MYLWQSEDVEAVREWRFQQTIGPALRRSETLQLLQKCFRGASDCQTASLAPTTKHCQQICVADRLHDGQEDEKQKQREMSGSEQFCTSLAVYIEVAGFAARRRPKARCMDTHAQVDERNMWLVHPSCTSSTTTKY